MRFPYAIFVSIMSGMVFIQSTATITNHSQSAKGIDAYCKSQRCPFASCFVSRTLGIVFNQSDGVISTLGPL